MRSAGSHCHGSVSSPDTASLSLRTGQSFLERMGVLYHDRIRLEIVAELYTREMSPKQFFEQVGGSTYDTVRRHFVKLVDYGWLRRVRTEQTGRGRPEHLYRSTELAVIDDETWEKIPTTIRDSFTVQNVLEMGERLADALSLRTLDSQPDSFLAYTTFAVDEKGRGEAIGALNQCFRALLQEQTDAKVRLEKSIELPVPMVVELGGFETVDRRVGPTPGSLPVAALGKGAPPWPRRISRIFSDPLDLEIVRQLNEVKMSPTELHDTLGGASVEGFDRRCKRLVKLGWIAKVEERTGGYRRGSTENYYRATSPAPLQTELFSDMPASIRTTASWGTFEEFCQSAMAAVRAGTFNQRADRHLTLCKLLIDETAWRQVIALLTNCSRSLAAIAQAAKYRLEGGQATSAHELGCFLAAFAGSGEPLHGRSKRSS
jgi:DNA-binding transcriptional ArsR family regulator